MESQPPFAPAPHQEAVYGPPEPPRRRIPRLALAGGIAAGLALGGAGIAYASSSGGSSPAIAAASDPSSTTPSTQPGTAPTKPGKFPPGRFGGREGGLGFFGLGGPGMGGKLLYGQATIQQPDGTTKTVEFQSGTVSEVSGSSITLASGSYTHTYKVDPSTVVDAQAGGISTVTKGDEVRLFATQQGGSDTAVNITDVTKIKSSRTGFGFQGGNEKAPPTTSASTGAPAAGASFGGGDGPGFGPGGDPGQLQ